MPDGDSPERADEPVHRPVVSVSAPQGPTLVAEPPTEKPAQRRPLWMWIAGECGSPADWNMCVFIEKYRVETALFHSSG